MRFFDINWLAAIFLSLLPLCIIGMAAVIIRDKVHNKRREKRCRRPIRDWREYGTGR